MHERPPQKEQKAPELRKKTVDEALQFQSQRLQSFVRTMQDYPIEAKGQSLEDYLSLKQKTRGEIINKSQLKADRFDNISKEIKLTTAEETRLKKITDNIKTKYDSHIKTIQSKLDTFLKEKILAKADEEGRSPKIEASDFKEITKASEANAEIKKSIAELEKQKDGKNKPDRDNLDERIKALQELEKAITKSCADIAKQTLDKIKDQQVPVHGATPAKTEKFIDIAREQEVIKYKKRKATDQRSWKYLKSAEKGSPDELKFKHQGKITRNVAPRVRSPGGIFFNYTKRKYYDTATTWYGTLGAATFVGLSSMVARTALLPFDFLVGAYNTLRHQSFKNWFLNPEIVLSQNGIGCTMPSTRFGEDHTAEAFVDAFIAKELEQKGTAGVLELNQVGKNVSERFLDKIVKNCLKKGITPTINPAYREKLANEDPLTLSRIERALAKAHGKAKEATITLKTKPGAGGGG